MKLFDSDFFQCYTEKNKREGMTMEFKCYERIEREYKEKPKGVFLKDENKKIEEIFSFEYQPIELIYDDEGIEHIELCGEILYKVRFTFKNEGKYILQVDFENGDVEYEEFVVQGYFNEGYVKVSKSDRRYFSYSTEKCFYPVGINLAFPKDCGISNGKEFGLNGQVKYMGLRQYERWFKRCSENGVNVVRIWAGHTYFSPDTENVEEYKLEQFTKFDMLLDLAKKYGLKLKITFEQFRFFSYEKDNNSYIFKLFNKNMYFGDQKCNSTEEWLTEEKWKDTWLNKINEFAKRYSGDTEIFAIELWNEMNCLGEKYGVLYSEIVKWNTEMIPKVKALFPDNLVVNSLGSLDCEMNLNMYNLFPWDKCDFKQMHRYLDQGGQHEDTTKNPVEVIQKGMEKIKDNKMPFVVAETGAVNNNHSDKFKYYSCDDRGIIFVDCVYTPLFLGSASCGHIWHWDDRYVESKNLYKYFKPLADMVSEIDFQSEEFESIDFSDDEAYIFILKGKNVSLGFVRNKSDCWQNVLKDFKNATVIKEKEISFNGTSIKEFKIWEDDTTKISVGDQKVKFENLLYGTIFKIM